MTSRSAPRGRSKYACLQEKRREDALVKQKSERHTRLQASRGMAALLGADEEQEAVMELEDSEELAGSSMDAEMMVTKARSTKARKPPRTDSGEHPKSYFASQFMQPEWMTDVPSDLGSSWYVMPRPEGKRCLLVSSGGRTVSRLRTGSVLHRLQSQLPEGSPASRSGGEDCVMDCIYHDADRTYYAQDLLMWRGHAFYDCTAEFRICWLHTKIAEESQPPPTGPAVAAVAAASISSSGGVAPGVAAASEQHAAHGSFVEASCCMDAAAPEEAMDQEGPCMGDASSWSYTASALPYIPMRDPQSGEEYRICALPASIADPAGLAAAHSGCKSFVQDGLYLLHGQGHYQAAGPPCPLALLWKDGACSRYLLDTDSKGATLQQQQITLEYRMDGTVATEDDPPIVLGQLPASFVEQMQAHLRPGRLLKFNIGEGGLMFHEGRPCGADLRYAGPGNQRRGRADQFSKIMFQYSARQQPITLEQLMQAAANPTVEEQMGQEGASDLLEEQMGQGGQGG